MAASIPGMFPEQHTRGLETSSIVDGCLLQHESSRAAPASVDLSGTPMDERASHARSGRRTGSNTTIDTFAARSVGWADSEDDERAGSKRHAGLEDMRHGAAERAARRSARVAGRRGHGELEASETEHGWPIDGRSLVEPSSRASPGVRKAINS